MKRKVAFIVDNPNRDLAGLTLTAEYLASRGVETHLIPLYDQFQHVCDIMPDIVVLNYVRQDNCELIKLYHDMGIKLAVLDTEGGVFINYNEILGNLVREQESLSRVSLYMVWGKILGDLYTEKFNGKIDTIFDITGVPRIDLYHPRFRRNLVNPLGKDYILLPTNHGIVNSRFNSVEDEIRNAQKVALFTNEIWKERNKVLQKTWFETLDLFENIFKSHPNKNFVIRPHPFENHDPYNIRFEKFKNVSICLDNNLTSWLEHAKCLLHLNCSTGIESAMIGKINISFNWLQHNIIKMPVVDDCSFKVENERDLHLAIDSLWQGKDLPKSLSKQHDQIEKALKKNIIDWFHAVDGKSHVRVAEKIIQTYEKSSASNPKMTFSSRLNLLKESLRRISGTIYFSTGSRRKDKILRRSRKSFTKQETEKITLGLLSLLTPSIKSSVILNSSNAIYRSERVIFNPK